MGRAARRVRAVGECVGIGTGRRRRGGPRVAAGGERVAHHGRAGADGEGGDGEGRVSRRGGGERRRRRHGGGVMRLGAGKKLILEI